MVTRSSLAWFASKPDVNPMNSGAFSSTGSESGMPSTSWFAAGTGAGESGPAVRPFEDIAERRDVDVVQRLAFAQQRLLGAEHDLTVVAGQVDQRVGFIRFGVLKRCQRLGPGQVHAVGQRGVVSVEVGRRVAYREQQPLVASRVRAFESRSACSTVSLSPSVGVPRRHSPAGGERGGAPR